MASNKKEEHINTIRLSISNKNKHRFPHAARFFDTVEYGRNNIIMELLDIALKPLGNLDFDSEAIQYMLYNARLQIGKTGCSVEKPDRNIESTPAALSSNMVPKRNAKQRIKKESETSMDIPSPASQPVKVTYEDICAGKYTADQLIKLGIDVDFDTENYTNFPLGGKYGRMDFERNNHVFMLDDGTFPVDAIIKPKQASISTPKTHEKEPWEYFTASNGDPNFFFDMD